MIGREKDDYSQWETEEDEKLKEMEPQFSPLVQTDAPDAEEGDNAYAVYYAGDKKEVGQVTITLPPGISEGRQVKLIAPLGVTSKARSCKILIGRTLPFKKIVQLTEIAEKTKGRSFWALIYSKSDV